MRGAKPDSGRGVPTTSALTIEAALAAMRDFWLTDGSLTIEQENQVTLARRKLLIESSRFLRSANASQREQFKKLRRFYQQATFGPALSTSSKRSRIALFLRDWQLFARSKGIIETGRMHILDALEYIQVLRPILEALHTGDDEFSSDLAIAMRFGRTQSRANAFLAEYSLLMAGKQPILTFSEIHKILRIPLDDLRKKIKELREKYGEWAVPLKRGKPGRPRKIGLIQK